MADKAAPSEEGRSCWWSCNKRCPGKGCDNQVLTLLLREGPVSPFTLAISRKWFPQQPPRFCLHHLLEVQNTTSLTHEVPFSFFLFSYTATSWGHESEEECQRLPSWTPGPHPSSSPITTSHQSVGGGSLHSTHDSSPCPILLKMTMRRDSKVISSSTLSLPWQTPSTKEETNVLFNL